jgi:hypothetical protein
MEPIFCCSGGKDEPREDGIFDQPGLGDYRVVEGGISDNLVEAQFADAERDSLGSHKQPLGVKDSDGTDVFSLMQFFCCCSAASWLSFSFNLLLSLLNLPAVNDLGASLGDHGLVTEAQYVGFCLSLTYTHCWELKSVGMLWYVVNGTHVAIEGP